MDTIIFQNESLPVQVELENVALREMHSEILHYTIMLKLSS